MRYRLGLSRPALALLLVLAAAGRSWAQAERTASAQALTAELLLRFAQFTEWPADSLATDGRLTFCATDPLVVEALGEVTANKTIGTHPVSVRQVQLASVPRDCSLLYAGGVDAKRVPAMIALLQNASVLTVGDTEAFIRAGGVIYLYIDDGRMRFVVNLPAAERARLHLSSKMLAYGRIVKD